jgi:DNA primase
LKLREAYDLRIVIPSTPKRKHYSRYDVDLCPFHSERNPSFLIYQDGYKCLSCGEQGDIVSWTCHSEQIDKEEAIRRLREGISSFSPFERKVEKPKRIEAEELNQSLGLKYHLDMRDEREWYRWRGLKDKTIDKFQLGYGHPYGHGRFTIPVYENGKLVNIRYRRDDRCPLCRSPNTEEIDNVFLCVDCAHEWTPSDKFGKYIGVKNHNEPRLFNCENYPVSRRIFITEGELDTVRLWQEGYTSVSSTGGCKSFLPSWSLYFLSYKKVYLVYDSDDAGKEAIERVLAVVPKARVVKLPCKDVTQFFKLYGRNDFEDLLDVADRDSNMSLMLAKINGDIVVE